MTSLRQINKQIKREVVSLMGKGSESYKNNITRNDDLFLESTITLVYESTCEIGKMVEYKVSATYNKFENTIKLNQF